ncbi:MAG: MFS transporter, partial [Bryobacteraceae bacterium]
MPVRFRVLAFGVCLAAVTYLDRVCISTTAGAIMRDLSLTQVEMSFVFSAFTFAYGLFEIPTGWWGDKIGTRRVLTRIVVWWSCFTIVTAASFNYASLLVFRFLFGVGEAGAWPNAAKTFSRWFPKSERGTAQGIFFMGAHLAGGITPILVTAMLRYMNWRWVFVIFGCVGFVWSAAWYRWFRDDPREHPAVGEAELRKIEAGRRVDESHASGRVAWGRLLRNQNLIALCIMYFTQSYGFYFYITWLPKYLEEVRGFTAMTLGALAGLPLLLCVAGDLFGGLTTDRVSQKFGLRAGRAGVGGASFLAGAVAMVAGTASNDPVTAAVLIAIAGGATAFPLGAAWGTCLDIGGARAGML